MKEVDPVGGGNAAVSGINNVLRARNYSRRRNEEIGESRLPILPPLESLPRPRVVDKSQAQVRPVDVAWNNPTRHPRYAGIPISQQTNAVPSSFAGGVSYPTGVYSAL